MRGIVVVGDLGKVASLTAREIFVEAGGMTPEGEEGEELDESLISLKGFELVAALSQSLGVDSPFTDEASFLREPARLLGGRPKDVTSALKLIEEGDLVEKGEEDLKRFFLSLEEKVGSPSEEEHFLRYQLRLIDAKVKDVLEGIEEAPREEVVALGLLRLYRAWIRGLISGKREEFQRCLRWLSEARFSLLLQVNATYWGLKGRLDRMKAGRRVK